MILEDVPVLATLEYDYRIMRGELDVGIQGGPRVDSVTVTVLGQRFKLQWDQVPAGLRDKIMDDICEMED